MLPKPKPPAKPPNITGATGAGGFRSSSVSYFYAPTILSGAGAETDPTAAITIWGAGTEF